MNILWIALGGALGALSRAGIGEMVTRSPIETKFPVGTLLANLVGCFLLGAAMAYISKHVASENTRAVQSLICIGFLGSLTTFSTFAYETRSLFSNEFWLAMVNIVVSVVAGLVLVVVGRAVANSLMSQ